YLSSSVDRLIFLQGSLKFKVIVYLSLSITSVSSYLGTILAPTFSRALNKLSIKGKTSGNIFPYADLILDRLHLVGQFRSGPFHLIKYLNRGVILITRRKRRTITDKFKKQVVLLYQNGKPRQEVIKEYDLSPSAFDRWVKQYANSGSFKEKDNRSPEEIELIKLRKENQQLKMEND